MIRMMRSDRGGVASTLIVLPILIVFIELVVLGGRVAAARADTNAAANEAARAASLAWDTSAAEDLLDSVATKSLNSQGVLCIDGADASFAEGSTVQRGGMVGVVVRCKVNMTDMGWLTTFFGVEIADIEIVGVGIEAVDPFRAFEGDAG